MKRLEFVGFDGDHPKPDFYRGPSGEWRKGDRKEVEDQEAERLLAAFPKAFKKS